MRLSPTTIRPVLIWRLLQVTHQLNKATNPSSLWQARDKTGFSICIRWIQVHQTASGKLPSAHGCAKKNAMWLSMRHAMLATVKQVMCAIQYVSVSRGAWRSYGLIQFMLHVSSLASPQQARSRHSDMEASGVLSVQESLAAKA